MNGLYRVRGFANFGGNVGATVDEFLGLEKMLSRGIPDAIDHNGMGRCIVEPEERQVFGIKLNPVVAIGTILAVFHRLHHSGRRVQQFIITSDRADIGCQHVVRRFTVTRGSL